MSVLRKGWRQAKGSVLSDKESQSKGVGKEKNLENCWDREVRREPYSQTNVRGTTAANV